jgi:hypothetical protein
MAYEQHDRLVMILGGILVLSIVVLGNYFYIKKISYDNEVKVNNASEESASLKEQNNQLLNREKGTLEQISGLKKSVDALEIEVANLKQLNQNLEQEKATLTEEIEQLKATNINSSVTPTLEPQPSILLPLPETVPLTPDKPVEPMKPVMVPEALFCPSVSAVNENLASGNWQQDSMTWWVSSSSRPLYDAEKILSLFKVISENNSEQAISCYYQAGEEAAVNNISGAMLAIRTKAPENQKIDVQGSHWQLCSEDEGCLSICESSDLSQCGFQLETVH